MSRQKTKLQFSVGDKVVHPRHGIGGIVDVEDDQCVEGFGPYYAIELPDQRLVIHVPACEVDALGVRAVMDPAEVARVLRVLRGKPGRLPENSGTRHKQIQGELDGGNPTGIAEAVRDLSFQERTVHFTKVDSDLLERGREFLVSEIAVVTGWETADVIKTVDSALESALAIAGAERPRGVSARIRAAIEALIQSGRE